MQNYEDEIKINILKYVDYSALTHRNWSVIVKNPYAKIEYLVAYYGKDHGLFHAVKLGPTFIEVMYFGSYDQKLIKLQIERNVGQFIFRAFQNDEYKQLADLPSKGSDIELSHFLSASPHVTNSAGMLKLKYIEYLTLNKRFRPFPPRPKLLQLGLNNDPHIKQQDGYSSKDSYKININKLNVMKSFDFLQRRSSLRQHLFSRKIHRRRQHRRQRNANRIYRRLNASINNQDTLNRIANLPQQIANDPFINQFFNGSLFI